MIAQISVGLNAGVTSEFGHSCRRLHVDRVAIHFNILAVERLLLLILDSVE